jgi:IclR family KDG regulon transcriptional repressor
MAIQPIDDAVNPKASTRLRTLERGLAVLEVLAEAEGPLSLSTIAQQIGLPVGTTHRILATLVANGYVERDLRTKWYELGMKVFELRGAVTNGAIRIAAEVRPFLRSLSRRTKVRVHLALYRGGNVVYIDRVDPRDEAPYVPLGRQAPAHATSLGKAILAFSPADEVTAYLAERLGKRFTSTTIVDAQTLRDEFELIRSRGYSTDHGEFQEGVSCVGAPVFDYGGRAVAAVSVAGTPEEIVPREAELAQAVIATAATISSRYGFRARELSSV